MKKFLAQVVMAALFMVPLATAVPVGATTIPNWNASGSYVVAFNYQSTDYAHDMTLVQDSFGSLTGSGGSPAGGPHTYMWQLTSGAVTGNAITIHADYTAPEDATTPLTTMHLTGTIAPDGSMSGTWTDNYQGGAREGTWTTTSGHAQELAGSLAAEDFGVVNYDSGNGILKGYTAGFGLTDATFEGVQSVVVQLFAGDTLLQTNTATPKVATDITGTQISSPFDVTGTFDYATDGYWTNVRASGQYGQSVPATRVVATVTLANGKVVTAENSNLTGDPATIFSSTDGTIGGDVTGGTEPTPGVLQVTGVTAVKTTATADGTFPNGWKYVFHVTVPTDETHLSMKFANWDSVIGSDHILVANNMRISSLEADNAGATILLTGANVYSTPTLHMTGDLDVALPGKQVDVVVEVAIPNTTVNGAYTTSYGVKTE